MFQDVKAAYHKTVLAAILARTRMVFQFAAPIRHLDLRQKLCLWPVQRFLFVFKRNRGRGLAMPLAEVKRARIYDAVDVSNSDTYEDDAAVRRDILGIPDGAVVIAWLQGRSRLRITHIGDCTAQVLACHPDTRFSDCGGQLAEELTVITMPRSSMKLNELGIATIYLTGHRTDVPRLIAGDGLVLF